MARVFFEIWQKSAWTKSAAPITKNAWVKESLHLCSRKRISWIFGLFFENVQKWKPHHWNTQEPRTRCTCICPMSTNKVALEHRSYKITPSIIDVWKWLQYINFYQQCPWFKIYRWLCLSFFYFFPLNFYLLLIARTHLWSKESLFNFNCIWLYPLAYFY